MHWRVMYVYFEDFEYNVERVGTVVRKPMLRWMGLAL